MPPERQRCGGRWARQTASSNSNGEAEAATGEGTAVFWPLCWTAARGWSGGETTEKGLTV